MHTRFLFPVMVATALHALVLFGFNSPSRPTTKKSQDDKPVDRLRIFPIDDERETPIVSQRPEESQVKGEREVLRPTGEEPPPRPTLDPFRMEAVRVPPTSDVAKIVPGVFGDPDGIGDQWTDRPVFNTTMLDNEPRMRAQVAPVYPAEAKRNGQTGKVWVEFVVDEQGQVLHPRIIRSSHPQFESVTLNAVERWRFEPGKKGGRAVRFRMVVPVVFDLQT